MNDITTDNLLRDSYLKQRSQLIDPKRAKDFKSGSPTAGGTVYITAADKSGQMISFIQSNYAGFGSGICIPDTGIHLQNRGAGFSLNPKSANVVGARKRPFHTIIPGFLMRNDQPVLSFGVMGGPMQAQGHIQLTLRTEFWAQEPQTAIDAPRWRFERGKQVAVEASMPTKTIKALSDMGHMINIENYDSTFGFGGAQIIKNLGNNFTLPIPLMNIINGGAHANNGLKIQEFMIRPDKARTFSEAMNICFLVIQSLKKLLISKNLSTSVGDEGGFAPMISKNEEALKLISNAIKKAGFVNGKDVSICLDVAANELFKNNKYAIDSKKYISYKNTILFYSKIIKRYKIKSIEDPFAENDWKAWSELHKKEKKIQIVGDDLYVTNLQRLKKGFLYQSSNSILIKLNQIGTVSETLDVIRFAQNIGYTTIISHRSGDSEDTFISDLAVGTNSNQIKTGSLCRSERVAKFNQLLRIEADLIKNNLSLIHI